MADLFKALSNPNRLRIFLRLASGCDAEAASCEEGEVCACVGDLGRDLGIAPSTVSHHIRELYQAGLIRMERRGQTIECRADLGMLRTLMRFFGGTTVGRAMRDEPAQERPGG